MPSEDANWAASRLVSTRSSRGSTRIERPGRGPRAGVKPAPSVRGRARNPQVRNRVARAYRSGVASPRMTTGTVPFEVDEAKLAPPMFRPASVDKTHAIEQLLASPAPFATVVAPAGYGKTTLLARCARPIRARSPGSPSTSATTMRWSCSGASPPRSTASSRSRRPVFEALSRTRRFRSGAGSRGWATRSPRSRGRSWSRSTTCTGSRTRRRSRCSPGSSTTCPRVEGGHHQPEEPGLPLARWRARGLCTRSGRRTSDSTVARPTSCCVARTSPSRQPTSSSSRSRRRAGRPGCIWPRCRSAPGRPIPAPSAGSPATTGSSLTTSGSRCCRACPRPRPNSWCGHRSWTP